ncbi:Arginine transport ATP-binding protein ArtP [Raoultella terrigena]|nr:Arginine transport ATP-binding protein ArtP [Raoultella terrigena]
MSIKLNGINCFYGAHQALFDITLDCPQGETLVLLGPSGAGKSSLLRVLNLLEMPRSGTLHIAGNTSTLPKRRLTKPSVSCARTSVWFSSSTICGRT